MPRECAYGAWVPSHDRCPPMPHTAIIVAWACALLVVVYLMFVVRYYYRVPDADEPVTIVQCTAATFTASLLRERMPVVCRGVGDLAGFKALAASPSTGTVSTSLEPSVGDSLYTSLRVPGWFCRRAPVVVRTTPPSLSPPVQSLADVALDVQLEGTRRVALWVPTTSCNTQTPLRRVDVVLSPGDGLFIPFQWWVAESDAVSGNDKIVDGASSVSRWCALRWENTVARVLRTNEWLGACGRWVATTNNTVYSRDS